MGAGGYLIYWTEGLQGISWGRLPYSVQAGLRGRGNASPIPAVAWAGGRKRINCAAVAGAFAQAQANTWATGLKGFREYPGAVFGAAGGRACAAGKP
jgi:hypothetical protein